MENECGESAARDEVGRPETPEAFLPRDAIAKRALSPLTQSMTSLRDMAVCWWARGRKAVLVSSSTSIGNK